LFAHVGGCRNRKPKFRNLHAIARLCSQSGIASRGELRLKDGVRQHHPSYHYDDLRIGAVLPPDGVTYYDIPGEYHVQGYRYAYVNDHAVLVDPRTRQIVEIVD
jgi:hypothetical protein